MSKIYLCSFASPDLNLSVNRFKNQAKLLNFYENIILTSYLMKQYYNILTLGVILIIKVLID